MIHVWLLALVSGASVPRRLVYVVNRRTVVDQTTEEAGKAALLACAKPPLAPVLIELAATLRSKCALPGSNPLAISTLRAQFADNRE